MMVYNVTVSETNHSNGGNDDKAKSSDTRGTALGQMTSHCRGDI